MSETTTPIPVRFPRLLREKIRAASQKTHLNQQQTIRMAVERGLPSLLASFEIPIPSEVAQ